MKDVAARKMVIIGLDGVPFGLLEDLCKRRIMPNTKSVIERGVLRRMESSIPEVSSVAWSSIITGKNPAEHGIFGFTDFPKGTYRLSFPNFNHLKARPFWEVGDNRRSVIVNVPSTFPASRMNGVLISGFVALDLERSVYPVSLLPKLRELDYRVDVDSSKAHESIEWFLRDLDKTLEARMAAYRYLWEAEDWDVFMLVFTGTDRLSHFLWDAYEEETHKHHGAFLEHFRKIDAVVGEVSERLPEDALLVMLSDHGFERLEGNFNVNYFLQQNGFLKIKEGTKEKKSFSDIDFGTKAFALDPARIYINREGKYPRGSVSGGEAEEVIGELVQAFESLEKEGRRVFRKIFRRDEVYEGAFIDRAPDLVLIGNTGLNLKANIGANSLWEKNIFTGKHTQDDAFIVINDERAKEILPGRPRVSDFVPMIERVSGRV